MNVFSSNNQFILPADGPPSTPPRRRDSGASSAPSTPGGSAKKMEPIAEGNSGDELSSVDSDGKSIIAVKSAHVLDWIIRKLCATDSPSETQRGSINLLRAYFRPDLNCDDLRVQVISESVGAGDGRSVCSLRVYDSAVVKHPLLPPPAATSWHRSSVLVKVAMPPLSNGGAAETSDDCPSMSLNQLDRAFFIMERLNKASPGSTAVPILCDFDHYAEDGSKYLVTEFLDRFHYDNYLSRFQAGSVDDVPAAALGEAFAHLHCSVTGVKDKVYDRRMLELFVSSAFEDVLVGLKDHSDKSDDVEDESGMASDNTLVVEEQVDAVRLVERVRENATNPPVDTGTCVNLDADLLSILLRESIKDPSFDDSVAPPTGQYIKLPIFEHCNWGPAGADLGNWLVGAMFYAVAHALLVGGNYNWTCIKQAVIGLWSSYENTYFKMVNFDRQSICKSLLLIAREAVGWAGFSLMRLSSPKQFRASLSIFTLPDGMEKILLPQHAEDMENFRMELSKLALKALNIGFGDSVHNNIPSDLESTQQAQDTIDAMLDEISAARNSVMSKIDGVGEQKMIVARRKSSHRFRNQRKSFNSMMELCKQLDMNMKSERQKREEKAIKEAWDKRVKEIESDRKHLMWNQNAPKVPHDFDDDEVYGECCY